jgi:uncharacterized heparinase superfamily protein
MTRFSLARLRRFDLAEIAWRMRGAADIAGGRVRSALKAPAWDRRDLASALGAGGETAPVVRALTAEDWARAHALLVTHFTNQPARFVIAPAMREQVVAEIALRFPASARDAAERADRMLAGRYDLLGYRDLPFDGKHWHRDEVHGKTAPLIFWSQVPYLDPSCGDHKIIWEINRHQHWMELGRAYWLTGDERYRAECLAQLDSWLTENPPLMGVNWASMLELGFRAISWIWALNFFVGSDHADRSPWLVDLLLGLDRQLAHIERHLSYYFSPNTHLLGEALALYVGGRTLPELTASARREATGRRILVQEITRQILVDGGHCERSAHYHRYTLDFYLLALAVARLTGDPVAAHFERTCVRLAEAARALADDTGRLPHIGDDDGGSVLPLARRPTDDARDSLAIAAALTGQTELLVGAPPEEVWWLLGHESFAAGVLRLERPHTPAGPGSVALPATGYYISRQDGDHLIVDAGPHGYMNAGHAHADALSLTFTRRGTPLLIDTGTGCYTVSPLTRDRFRSTPLHNTLTLNGRSQSLPRGPFHWRHMANGVSRRWQTTSRFDYFAGMHDGYLPFVHVRHVLLLHGDLLVIADCIAHSSKASKATKASKEERESTQAAVHWHLDPAWAVALRENGAVLTTADQSVELVIEGGAVEHFHGDEATGLGWHAPVYGSVEPTSTLRISSAATAPFWMVSVFGLDPANAVHTVRLESLGGNSMAFLSATAVGIGRACSRDHLVIAEPREMSGAGMWRSDNIESDAAMLFTRSVGAAITDLAVVDTTIVRGTGDPRLDQRHPSRVPNSYITLERAGGGPGHARSSSEHRKGAECAESRDSLMVRQ